MNQSNRWIYATACVSVIALGLASRHFGTEWGRWVVAYAGDVLWATMVVMGLAWLLPRLSTKQVGLLALTLCFAVEWSQLLQTPWLNELRRTSLGGLILGRGFLWSDMGCYVVGVGLGLAVKVLLDGVFKSPPPAPTPSAK
jgi:Protein of unknown function (DUF2809)